MTTQIVLGYNGSAASMHAAHWAASEAMARDVPLRMRSSYTIPPVGYGGEWVPQETIAEIADAAKHDANRMRDQLVAAHPGLVVDVEITRSPVHAALTEHVDPDDLLVVGASAHEGFAGLLLGNDARWLARHSTCPVAIVRGAATDGRPNRVVVGVDGSAASDRAVRWAADEADLHQVELVVVHAWDYPYGLTDNEARVRDLMRVDAACVLDRSVELARERCGSHVSGQLVQHSPVAALMDAVLDGDVLVISSRGHSALSNVLGGSTVTGVLDYAAVPVVVVR